MEDIKLNDLLQLTREEIDKTKIRFMVPNDGINFNPNTDAEDPKKQDKVNLEALVYNREKSMSFTDGIIAIGFIRIRDDYWLMTGIVKVIKDNGLAKPATAEYLTKKFNFRFVMLETTQYNYKDLAKTYRELTANGQSKFLPMIALGHSQSSVLNLAYFENEILDLPSIMIPPLLSSTMNGQTILDTRSQRRSSNSQNTSESTGGRPEKPDSEKSEKTIQNLESQS